MVLVVTEAWYRLCLNEKHESNRPVGVNVVLCMCAIHSAAVGRCCDGYNKKAWNFQDLECENASVCMCVFVSLWWLQWFFTASKWVLQETYVHTPEWVSSAFVEFCEQKQMANNLTHMNEIVFSSHARQKRSAESMKLNYKRTETIKHLNNTEQL